MGTLNPYPSLWGHLTHTPLYGDTSRPHLLAMASLGPLGSLGSLGSLGPLGSLGSLGSLGPLRTLAALSTRCQAGAVHGSRCIRDLRQKSWARSSTRKGHWLVRIPCILSLIPHHIRGAHLDSRERTTLLVQRVGNTLFARDRMRHTHTTHSNVASCDKRTHRHLISPTFLNLGCRMSTCGDLNAWHANRVIRIRRCKIRATARLS